MLTAIIHDVSQNDTIIRGFPVQIHHVIMLVANGSRLINCNQQRQGN